MNLTNEQREKILNAVLVLDEERIRITDEINDSVKRSINLGTAKTKIQMARESLASMLVNPTPMD